MAGVLKYGSVGSGDRHFRFPRLCPRVRVLDREFVFHRFLARASEAFGQLEIAAGSLKSNFVVEVCRFDNKSVSFPVSARIAQL